MPGILWSAEEKDREWAFAKEKLMPHGELLPNGSKLRRKDYPDNINHSFMVIDDRIIAFSGKGVHLGSGRDAHTKLAEDEEGNLIALKIVTRDGYDSSSLTESHIAHDLGIAGQRITRSSASQRYPTKHYIAYKYLGTRLLDYINSRSLSLDKCYELCIKVSLALHDMHTGKKTKSKKSYQHNDIHWGNLVIDDQEEPHFIDYGRAWGGDEPGVPGVADIVEMLLLFFTPKQYRNYEHKNWIFGDWLGEYDFSYNKPRFNEKRQQYMAEKHVIYIYTNPSDQKEDGSYSIVHYLVRDLAGVCQEGVVELEGLGLTKLLYTEKGENGDELLCEYNLSEDDKSLIEDKVLETASSNGHIISKSTRNDVLFDLLKDPRVLRPFPTAFDIAETLTLCRLQLEAFQGSFVTRSENARLEAVRILNSMTLPLLALYEKLNALPNKSSGFDEFIKNYIVTHLIVFPKDEKDDSAEALDLQLATLHEDDARSLRQNIDDIIIGINHARESWQAKSKSILRNESNLQHQQKLPDVRESELPIIPPVKVSKLEIVGPISIDDHNSPPPLDSSDTHSSSELQTPSALDTEAPHQLDTSSTIQPQQDELEEQNHSASAKRSLNVLKSGFEDTLGKMQTELQTESNPVFAEEGKKLHDALSDTKEKFIQTGDSNQFIHSVKKNVKKSEPTLKNSPVWKQFLLDILNAAILICTLGISYMVTGRVRLLTVQPQESEIDEAKTMRQSLQ